MEEGAGGGVAGEAFEGLVEEVAGVEIGGDEDVGVASDLGIWEFFGGDVGTEGGVELHFAVDEEVGTLESFKNGMDEVDRGVVAAAAVSRKGEEGDAGRFGEDFLSGSGGLEDDVGELVFSWVFAGGHVGEEEGLILGLVKILENLVLALRLVLALGGLLEDGEAGEGGISVGSGENIRGGV